MLDNQVNQMPRSSKPFQGETKHINCSTFERAWGEVGVGNGQHTSRQEESRGNVKNFLKAKYGL